MGRKDGEMRDGARRDRAGNKQRRAWTRTRWPLEQTQGLLGAKHLSPTEAATNPHC